MLWSIHSSLHNIHWHIINFIYFHHHISWMRSPCVRLFACLSAFFHSIIFRNVFPFRNISNIRIAAPFTSSISLLKCWLSTVALSISDIFVIIKSENHFNRFVFFSSSSSFKIDYFLLLSIVKRLVQQHLAVSIYVSSFCDNLLWNHSTLTGDHVLLTYW